MCLERGTFWLRLYLVRSFEVASDAHCWLSWQLIAVNETSQIVWYCRSYADESNLGRTYENLAYFAGIQKSCAKLLIRGVTSYLLNDGGRSREGVSRADRVAPRRMQTTERGKNLPFQDRNGIAVKQLERGVQFRFRFARRSPHEGDFRSKFVRDRYVLSRLELGGHVEKPISVLASLL